MTWQWRGSTTAVPSVTWSLTGEAKSNLCIPICEHTCIKALAGTVIEYTRQVVPAMLLHFEKWKFLWREVGGMDFLLFLTAIAWCGLSCSFSLRFYLYSSCKSNVWCKPWTTVVTDHQLNINLLEGNFTLNLFKGSLKNKPDNWYLLLRKTIIENFCAHRER